MNGMVKNSGRKSISAGNTKWKMVKFCVIWQLSFYYKAKGNQNLVWKVTCLRGKNHLPWKRHVHEKGSIEKYSSFSETDACFSQFGTSCKILIGIKWIQEWFSCLRKVFECHFRCPGVSTWLPAVSLERHQRKIYRHHRDH